MWIELLPPLVLHSVSTAGRNCINFDADIFSLLEGEWSKWTAEQRSDVMNRLADLIEKHSAELGLWETKSMGQPVAMTKFVYQIVPRAFRYMAGWTNKLPGEQWPEEDGIYKV